METSSYSPDGKTVKSEVEDTIADNSRADKKKIDVGDSEDDLNLFISKIESNIQKYSKIINESQSETHDKNKETSETIERTSIESPRNKRKPKKHLASVNTDQTDFSPRAKRRRTAGGGGKEEDGDRRDICQYCDEDYRGRPAASTQLWLHIERQHLRVFYTCTMCDYQVGVCILSKYFLTLVKYFPGSHETVHNRARGL